MFLTLLLNEAPVQVKKSWREKLERKMEPKVVDIPEKWAATIGHGKMVILTPKIIDRFIRSVPKGKLVTINSMRNYFAKKYDVDVACPMTTGIFTWICAWAADEAKREGELNITPYWRVLKEGGRLNPKFPGGVNRQADLLRKEGYELVQSNSGSAYSVKDYTDYLFK